MIDLRNVPPHLFLWALASELRRPAKIAKVQSRFLAAIRLQLGADAAWLFRGLRATGRPGVRLLDGDERLCDENLARAFVEERNPEVPRNVLLSPLRIRGARSGVVGVARDQRDFELGDGRVLTRLCAVLGTELARREERRQAHVLDRIKEKVVAELRPRDLAYQILDGLYQLVHYDHSAALLTHVDDGVLKVEAEKIVWTKTKSTFVGHEIPVTPEVLKRLRRRAEPWTLSPADEKDGPLHRLLDYYRGEEIPETTSIVCAPLFIDGEFLGLLKLAGWKIPAVDRHDLEVVERFLPVAKVALRNVRDRLSLEQQAMQAEVRAGLVTLARAVAHDVSNAMGGILPLAEQMQEDLRQGRFDPQALEQDLDVILDNARLCNRIFSNMLRVGVERSGSGPVDVNAVIGEMLPLMEARTAPRSIRLDLHLVHDLPFIRCSKQHLERIVWNLFDNALDAIGKGPGRIELSTRANDDGEVILAVGDNGSGIESAVLQKVQEPFFTTKPTGTGLGLSLCRSLAWQYGGTIKIDSTPGEGTRVEVRWPVETARKA